MSDTNTIETIMTEIKLRRDWNNPEEVEIWFEARLREVEAEVRAEERARVRGEIEATPATLNVENNNSQQIYENWGRQAMKKQILSTLDKPLQVKK